MACIRKQPLESFDWAEITTEVRRAILALKVRSKVEYLESKGDTVDDLVQSALLNIFENIKTFDESKSSIKTYASIRARQSLIERIKYWRRDMRSTTGRSLSIDHSVNIEQSDGMHSFLGREDDMSAMLIREQTGVVRSELGDKVAEVFSRTYQYGQDQRVIAKAIGMSTGRVSQFHLMALSLIREKGEIIA